MKIPQQIDARVTKIVSQRMTLNGLVKFPIVVVGSGAFEINTYSTLSRTEDDFKECITSSKYCTASYINLAFQDL